VALYGQPADMDEINAVAARHKLPVIEDAAQSFGATYKGRQSGNLSTIGCTSFSSKPLAAMATAARRTNDARLRRQCANPGAWPVGRARHTALVSAGAWIRSVCGAARQARALRLGVRQRIEIAAHYDALLASSPCN
jgi:UDP-2-acetamido-2-deoxy-ribo-hexuluronate aminotransferase